MKKIKESEEQMQEQKLFNQSETRSLTAFQPRGGGGFYSLNKGSAAVQMSEHKRGFTKPSRATSEARVERASTETLSGLRAEAEVVLAEAFASKAKTRNAVEGEQPSGFRCKRERWRLMRGAVSTSKTRAAFTLAEVLITLAIIGVVAAMTIPTLIAKINEKVTENQKKVFEAKVLKGLNLTRTHGDLNNTYTSTYDFLQNGLGKHLKMAKICDASHIRDCVPYDTILYTTSDNQEDSVDVKDIDSAEELGKTEDEGYKDIASFVMGDGTVVIATYKKDCLVDEGKLDRDIGENPCFAGIYDLNGTRKPNKMGKDLLTFNGATLNINKGPAVLATIGGVKLISNVAVPTPMTKAECEENKSKYGINKCYYDSDYWAGAVKTCKDLGSRLPTEAELTKIAQELYNDPSLTNDYKDGLTLDTSKIPSALSGLGSSWYTLWSSSEDSADGASNRYFNSSFTFRGSNSRSNAGFRAVCVE